jgi:hypothetical protein
MTRFIGIDPAPSKVTVICERIDDGPFAFDAWPPHTVRQRVADRLTQTRDVVLTWDAPLRLDPVQAPGAWNYSSRRIDAAVKEWLAAHAPPEQGAAMSSAAVPSIEPKAVGVMHASGCSHNLLTQHVWGLPVGDAPAHGAQLLVPGMQLAPRNAEGSTTRPMLAEVHPAVTLAVWWLRNARSADPMPRYKRIPTPRMILDLLDGMFGVDFPVDQIMDKGGPGKPDDRLDAWIACRMAIDWTENRAHAVGPPHGGSYLLPTSLRWDGASESVKEVAP